MTMTAPSSGRAPVQNINAGRLTKQQGAPRVGSARSPHRQAVAESLSPQRLAQLMRAADEGDPQAYFTLCEEMEEREPHYLSVLQSRKMAVSGTPATVEAPKDAAASKEITEWVEQRIVLTPVFEGLVHDLMDGVPKGISLVETLWQRDDREWYPRGYDFRDQRHFIFDKDSMTRPLLRSEEQDEGEELEPYKWIVHKPKLRSGIPLRVGIARTIAVTYAAKRWTVADWMAFLDIYGIPVRIGKYPAHLADRKGALLRAVRQLGSDAAAVIPTEMEVEILESKSGGTGTTLFQQSAEYWDKQTSKVVLGQTMTTDDGASLSQSKIHQETKFEIRDADSRAICATIDRDLIIPAVNLNFGPQKVYPRVRIVQRRAEDMVPLMTATKTFVDMGGKVQMSEARDRLGYAVPEDGAELLQPAAKVAAPPPAPDDDPDSKLGDPADDDTEIEGDGKSTKIEGEKKTPQKELNAEQRSARPAFDATDELSERELADWRRLEGTNVGRLIKLIQEADSYEEARALLEELKRDEGDVLDVGALVVSLARQTFKLRGIGDATDKVKP